MKTVEVVVEEEIRLIDLIEKTFPNCSRTKRKEILEKRIVVASRRISQFDYLLKKGSRVMFVGSDKENIPAHGRMPVVFEDQWLLVVEKPVGLLSSSSNVGDITVISELNEMFAHRHSKNRAHVVHRLDRDTSGLLLVAKSKEIARELEKNWKETVYDRAYVALTWGTPSPKVGTIRSWLSDGEWGVVSSQTENDGKLAITHYKVLKNCGKWALVEMRLDTGRRNQIRVHMKDIGHPLLKDPIYGFREDSSPINRLALHAWRLGFCHPKTGKKIKLESEIPIEFKKIIEAQ